MEAHPNLGRGVGSTEKITTAPDRMADPTGVIPTGDLTAGDWSMSLLTDEDRGRILRFALRRAHGNEAL